MGNSGVFRWLRKSPPKSAANDHRRREPPAANRHRRRGNGIPTTPAANHHHARDNASASMPAANSRRRRRENSPIAANRRRRVDVEDDAPENCGACIALEKSCDGCVLSPYFLPSEVENFKRINSRVRLTMIKKVATELVSPTAVMRRLEELVDAVDMENTTGVLKMKKENAAIKGENENLRKQLQENNQNMFNYLSTHTGAGMPNPAIQPYQAPQIQYQGAQMQHAYQLSPPPQMQHQHSQVSQMQYAYQHPQAPPMQYQPLHAQQMPPYHPTQMAPPQTPTYQAPRY